MLINDRIFLRWVVCQVQEQCDTLHTAVLFEIAREETRSLQVDTHGSKDNGEVVRMSIVYTFCGLSGLCDQTSLPTDLRGDFVVRQTGSREDGDFLTTGNGVHGVNSRDTSGNHFFRVHLLERSALSCVKICRTYSRIWVDRTTVDVQVVFSQNLGSLVNCSSGTIEDTPQHVFGYTKLQAVATELDFCLTLSVLIDCHFVRECLPS